MRFAGMRTSTWPPEGVVHGLPPRGGAAQEQGGQSEKGDAQGGHTPAPLAGGRRGVANRGPAPRITRVPLPVSRRASPFPAGGMAGLSPDHARKFRVCTTGVPPKKLTTLRPHGPAPCERCSPKACRESAGGGSRFTPPWATIAKAPPRLSAAMASNAAQTRSSTVAMCSPPGGWKSSGCSAQRHAPSGSRVSISSHVRPPRRRNPAPGARARRRGPARGAPQGSPRSPRRGERSEQ